MPSNQLVINAARGLYLKYGGRRHRQIECEMHALGCLSFSRRVFYDQKSGDRVYLGWIKKYKWNEQLEKPSSLDSGRSEGEQHPKDQKPKTNDQRSEPFRSG